MKEGRKKEREEGLTDGRKKGRKEGRKQYREGGRTEGSSKKRKNERKLKEGRKEDLIEKVEGFIGHVRLQLVRTISVRQNNQYSKD
jgi:hypothetical protein